MWKGLSKMIDIQQLYTALSGYSLDTIESYLKKEGSPGYIYIHSGELLHILLYIIADTFGDMERYTFSDIVIDTVAETEDSFDDSWQEESDYNSKVCDIVTPTMLKSMAPLLAEYNVYFGGNTSFVSEINNRLMIVSMNTFQSRDTFLEHIQQRYTDMGVTVVKGEGVPFLIYVKGMVDFLEHAKLISDFSAWDLTALIIFNKRPADTEVEHLALEHLLKIYGSIIVNNYIIDCDVSPYFRTLNTGSHAPVTPAILMDTYKAICSIEPEFIIITVRNLHPSLINIFALAYIMHNKKMVSNSQVLDVQYAQAIARLRRLDGFPIGERLQAFLVSHTENSLEVHVSDSGHVSLVRINTYDLNLKYTLASLDDIASFIKQSDNDDIVFKAVLPQASLKDILHLDTERSLDIFEVMPDDGSVRYRLASVYDALVYLHITQFPVKSQECYIYQLLRLMEKVMLDHSEIKVYNDIFVVYDTSEDRWLIGFGSLDPTFDADKVQIGSIFRVQAHLTIDDKLTPLGTVYDWPTVIPMISKAYDSSHIPINFSDVIVPEAATITPLQEYLALFYISDNPYQRNSWARLLHENSDVKWIGLRNTKPYTRIIRERWLPHAKKHITSYGLSLLPMQLSPITIYGGINYDTTTGSGGKSKLNIYWEAMKKHPD